MKKTIKNIFFRAIPHFIADLIYYNHREYKKTVAGNISFSQEGEDMVLRRIFSNKQIGTYVDIGAHHPTIFSNTKYFYLKGWTGINVEPIPGSKKKFDEERPNDTNLELIICEDQGLTEFYMFEPSLMNTMSKDQAEQNKKFEWCTFKSVELVMAMPLEKILDQYLADDRKIDFMSIDVEGAEMAVLKSNNWTKYMPDVLLVEIIDTNIKEVLETEVHNFLSGHSFVFFAKTGNTVFYKRKGFFEF
ncbi:FkbM family methyltransferase [Mucilaginibacter sp. BT774]|uniref:FkbM family methyltransferase n=1 Tax=Mucilaginibacter sp. BT774 TaxID=3062276 RepID=UPI002675CA3F|nr:FkbM family methyltransferase [Mucilaginibacter sp. BT774]MDO3627502.1 FkbM family methyltransferase [Mucilaginibacter sp. BT774]